MGIDNFDKRFLRKFGRDVRGGVDPPMEDNRFFSRSPDRRYRLNFRMRDSAYIVVSQHMEIYVADKISDIQSASQNARTNITDGLRREVVSIVGKLQYGKYRCVCSGNSHPFTCETAASGERQDDFIHWVEPIGVGRNDWSGSERMGSPMRSSPTPASGMPTKYIESSLCGVMIQRRSARFKCGSMKRQHPLLSPKEFGGRKRRSKTFPQRSKQSKTSPGIAITIMDFDRHSKTRFVYGRVRSHFLPTDDANPMRQRRGIEAPRVGNGNLALHQSLREDFGKPMSAHGMGKERPFLRDGFSEQSVIDSVEYKR